MSEFGSQIIFKQLIERHQRVQIPMIQRDYAQGRAGQEEVRQRFLDALHGALARVSDDPELPLNLDFIYGSFEGLTETSFLPLDGQQRLTTLLLLHWYLAWQDGCQTEFERIFYPDGHARFSYSVRSSSKEFFDELMRFMPPEPPAGVSSLSELITDEPWYFRYWRLDPTIRSALGMLDAIHQRFKNDHGFFARLCDEAQPAITFQLLDLKDFGLSDDLYIKMNARGKPLTEFENFKARYEQELEKQFEVEESPVNGQTLSIANFVAQRMDTVWSDLFWMHRDRATNLYDAVIMNVFRALALVTRDPAKDGYLSDLDALLKKERPPSYADFDSKNWLDPNFTRTLIPLFEAWSSGCANGESTGLTTQLPDSRYFDEKAIFNKIAANPADLTYAETVQFAAYVAFIRQHEGHIEAGAFQDWMRIISNLASNTLYYRPSDLQRSVAGVLATLPQSARIVQHFAHSQRPIAGFSQEQIDEEKLKAQLIVGHGGWRQLIEEAENHGYFRGQIEFLLNFSGVVAGYKMFLDSVEDDLESFDSETRQLPLWDDAIHGSYQEEFKQYLKKANKMFFKEGLRDPGEYLWERALLSIGDYMLLSGGQNYSFLVDPLNEPDSWKRLLRGSGAASDAREVLFQLWQRLDADQPVKDQLDQIINATTELEPWREELVKTPQAIEYCEKRVIRDNGVDVYLLKRRQMNGAHVELFSYCLYHNVLVPLSEQGRLAPLELHDYVSVYYADTEPYIPLTFQCEGHELSAEIQCGDGLYFIRIDCAPLRDSPDARARLNDALGFTAEEPDLLSQSGELQDFEKTLLAFAEAVKQLP